MGKMEGSNELRKIEKEVIEARGLVIKSNNLTNSLAADVRSIARKQASYERNLNANNFVIILVIASLSFLGAHLAYNARHSSLKRELALLEEKAKTAQEELQLLKVDKGEIIQEGEKDFVALYELIREGSRIEAIEAYSKINPNSFSFLERKLLEDIVRQFRGDLSMQHYMKALELSSQNKNAEAVEEFLESLRHQDDAGHSKAARIHMANALRLSGKPREAIAILQKVSEEHLERELADDALWYLALSHEDAHQKDEALAVLMTLIRRYPDSQYLRSARIRAGELRLGMWRDDIR